MARIRNIKPEFWDDESIGRLPFEARLTFIGLWNLMDKNGITTANPKLLLSKLFPFDTKLHKNGSKKFNSWLKSIETEQLVIRFEHDSKQFYFCPTFSKHQIISKNEREKAPLYGLERPKIEELIRLKGAEKSTEEPVQAPTGTIPEPYRAHSEMPDIGHRTYDIGHISAPALEVPDGVPPPSDTSETPKVKSSKPVCSAEATLVVQYLNEKTGKNFKPEAQASRMEKALQNFTVEQLKQVIDIKMKDPWYRENPKFLRPSTLFQSREKIDGFLNESKEREGEYVLGSSLQLR